MATITRTTTRMYINRTLETVISIRIIIGRHCYYGLKASSVPARKADQRRFHRNTEPYLGVVSQRCEEWSLTEAEALADPDIARLTGKGE